VQQEQAEGEPQVGGALPTQRTGSALPPPGQSGNDETVILPAFLTGKKAAEPKPAEPARHGPEGALPASERGMLIFVAALLGVGTIAVVGLLGLGGLTKKKPTPTPVPAPKPPAAIVTVPSATPSPTPSPSPSAGPASPSPTATARRSPTPARSTALGTLTSTDPYTYCYDTRHGIARAPGQGDKSWTCVAGNAHSGAADFSPTDVCRWRFSDNGAYAVVGSLGDPSTWRCFT
jgi:hypothetical protein